MAPLGHMGNLSDFGASDFLQLTNLDLRANQCAVVFAPPEMEYGSSGGVLEGLFILPSAAGLLFLILKSQP